MPRKPITRTRISTTNSEDRLPVIATPQIKNNGIAPVAIVDPISDNTSDVDVHRRLQVAIPERLFGDAFTDGYGVGADAGTFNTPVNTGTGSSVYTQDAGRGNGVRMTNGVTIGGKTRITSSVNAIFKSGTETSVVFDFDTGVTPTDFTFDTVSNANINGVGFSMMNGTPIELTNDLFQANLNRYEIRFSETQTILYFNGKIAHTFDSQDGDQVAGKLNNPLQAEIYEDTSIQTLFRIGCYTNDGSGNPTDGSYVDIRFAPRTQVDILVKAFAALRLGIFPDLNLSTSTLASLELIGVKGADGTSIASPANPIPFSATLSPVQEIIDTNNTTTATLTAGSTFTGTSTNILGYPQINVSLFGRPNVVVSGDASDAKGSLFFEFSSDNVNWDISVPIIIRTLGVFIPYPLINVGKFFRLRHLNDGGASAIAILGTGETPGTPTNQTVFRLTTYLLPAATTGLARTLDQVVTGSDPATLNRSALMAKTPDRQFNNLRATSNDILRTRDESSETFGSLVTSARFNQIEIRFDKTFNASEITNTSSGSGSTTQASGHALYATGATNNGTAKGVSVATVVYKPRNEIFAAFTASFVTPTNASSFQRIGIYDTNNGFFIGFEALTFGVSSRVAAVDTFVNRTAFNGDLLNGNAASDFTRGGVPEAIDLTKSNVFQIAWGHLGSAPIKFQVMAPDGHFVTFHTIRQPNTQIAPSLQNPDLPITVNVSKTSADSTNLIITTGSWAAGTTADPSGTKATLANGAETAVSSSAVQILAANTNRKRAVVQNTGIANIRVGITGVTATTGVRLIPNGIIVYEFPNCETNALFSIREGAVDSTAFAQETV